MIILACLLFAIGSQFPQIPQNQSYHDFADQKPFFNIPNAWNVLSNIPFLVVGLWGLYLLYIPKKILFIDSRQSLPWVGFSIGLILIAIASSYYHLAPDNARLVWDRSSMMIAFASYAAALICERINITFGLWLWPIFLFIGIGSILMWIATETVGKGDLRFYFGVEAFIMILPLVILLAPRTYTRSFDIVIATFFYILALVFDHSDKPVYQFTNHIISGHTLKHIVAAFAGFWLIRMIWKRKPIQPNEETKV